MIAGDQLAFQFPAACTRCGSVHDPRDPPPHPLVLPFTKGTVRPSVTWQCVVCEGLVCSACVVCKAFSSHPPLGPEIFEVTYCSPRCREANRAAHRLGKALHPDDEIWERCRL